jgi:hypothetical protein
MAYLPLLYRKNYSGLLPSSMPTVPKIRVRTSPFALLARPSILRSVVSRCHHAAKDNLEPREPSSGVWERATILEYLSKARRHVMMGKRNTDRRRELVAWLERKDHDSQEAKRMPALCGELQNLHIAGRHRF